jgi:hypothetical protein
MTGPDSLRALAETSPPPLNRHGGSFWPVSSGPIEPLTLLQRRLAIALAIVVAATRFLAASHSMWDWDEALFASALHHYDVAQHHPHPPGFPLFFALAKVARLVIHDDFNALRDISILASLFVFPAMFALARSLRFRFRTCVVAALLFSFLPNVWYWGGTAFTDELALVTSLAGAAFLLRDDRRRGTYLGGCLLFAATMLVRAQNVLLAWPWVVASWRRLRAQRKGNVVAGTAIIVVLVVVGYGIAAKLTGFEEYILATTSHQHYVATVDGALNPMRIPMRYLFYDFLFDPFQSNAAAGVMFGFVLIAFARPRRAHVHVLLTFLPNFFLAWFFLNPSGISRLSLGYIASNILLAADGMDVAASFIASRVRALPPERLAAAVQAFFAALTIGLSVVWVWAGLKEVRTIDSPTVQAMRWIRQNVPRGGKIYMQGGLEPFTAYFLPDYRIVPVPDDFDASKAPAETNVYLVSDHPGTFGQSINFRRPRKRLWALFNRRYFEASVVPMSGWVRFGAGWYGEEQGAEGEQWRWMGKESHILLAPLRSRALLGFTATFPLDSEPAPMVTITFDGSVIDRFVPKKRDVQRSYIVMSGSGRPDELVISVDQAINPARMHVGNDARDLALQLRLVTWKRL